MKHWEKLRRCKHGCGFSTRGNAITLHENSCARREPAAPSPRPSGRPPRKSTAKPVRRKKKQDAYDALAAALTMTGNGQQVRERRLTERVHKLEQAFDFFAKEHEATNTIIRRCAEAVMRAIRG